MLGQVAGALQVGAHPQGGDHDPQIGGDRLLPRQQRDRPGLQFALEVVDLLVGGDDALGELEVRVEHRRGGAPDRGADEPGHLDQALADRIELLVVRVPHRVSSLVTCRSGRPAGPSRGPWRPGAAATPRSPRVRPVLRRPRVTRTAQQTPKPSGPRHSGVNRHRRPVNSGRRVFEQHPGGLGKCPSRRITWSHGRERGRRRSGSDRRVVHRCVRHAGVPMERARAGQAHPDLPAHGRRPAPRRGHRAVGAALLRGGPRRGRRRRQGQLRRVRPRAGPGRQARRRADAADGPGHPQGRRDTPGRAGSAPPRHRPGRGPRGLRPGRPARLPAGAAAGGGPDRGPPHRGGPA